MEPTFEDICRQICAHCKCPEPRKLFPFLQHTSHLVARDFPAAAEKLQQMWTEAFLFKLLSTLSIGGGRKEFETFGHAPASL